MLIVIYASLKFDQLYSRTNPSISSTEELSALSESDKLNLGRSSLKFAFWAENFNAETLDDKRYVRTIVMLHTDVGDDEFAKPIQYHKCNQSDFEDFSPPLPSA